MQCYSYPNQTLYFQMVITNNKLMIGSTLILNSLKLLLHWFRLIYLYVEKTTLQIISVHRPERHLGRINIHNISQGIWLWGFLERSLLIVVVFGTKAVWAFQHIDEDW